LKHTVLVVNLVNVNGAGFMELSLLRDIIHLHETSITICY